MGKVFEHETIITIGDTNLLQNVYFVNYFHLQGITRELWVKEAVQGGIECLQQGLFLITRSAACTFIRDLHLYDCVVIQLQISKINKASADLRFKFLNKATGELCAEGTQTIVFAAQDHKPCRIPECFLRAGIEYSEGEVENL